MLAEVAARPTSSRSSVTTGGDVSRFWIPVSGRVSSPRQQPAYNGGSAPSQTYRSASVPSGPVVRVTRGDKVTEISVGGK
jgi:pilus assembly protein CpaB